MAFPRLRSRRRKGGRDLSRPLAGASRVWLLTAVTALAAAALHREVASPTLPAAEDLGVAILLALGFAAAEVLVVHLPYGRDAYSFSLSEVPLVVGLYFADPAVLILARVIGGGVALLCHRRQPLRKLGFNVGHFWLETGVAVLVWEAALGAGDPLGPAGWLAVVTTIIVVDLLGTALIAVAICVQAGRVDAAMLRDVLSVGPAAALANVSFGLVVVNVLSVDWRGAWALLVLGGLLFVAHRAYGSLHRRHDNLERLARFARHVGHQGHLEATANAILEQARAALQAERAELTLSARLTGAPVRFVAGPPGDAGRTARPDASEAFAPGPDALLVAADTKDADARAALERRGWRDAVVAPLRGDNGVIGELVVGDRIGDVTTFTPDDVLLLEALASYASTALHGAHNAWLAFVRAREATHDALTELPNRRLFDQEVTAAVEHAARAESQLAVAFLDLDGFKPVNDVHGHHVGDAVLRIVADRLRSAVRPTDVVARLGGDEFAVLLRDAAGVPAATAAIERLQQALAQPCEVDGLRLVVGGSFGIALYPLHGEDPATLLRCADAAMYAAKHGGGGVVVHDGADGAEEPVPPPPAIEGPPPGPAAPDAPATVTLSGPTPGGRRRSA